MKTCAKSTARLPEPARILVSYSHALERGKYSLLGLASSVDVSLRGLRFVAHQPMDKGAMLAIDLVLDGRSVHVDSARVVRMDEMDGGFEVAVEFVAADAACWRAIRDFVDERLTHRRAG